jgi:hypothetical protein
MLKNDKPGQCSCNCSAENEKIKESYFFTQINYVASKTLQALKKLEENKKSIRNLTKKSMIIILTN